MTRYDALMVGTGQAAPSMATALVKEGKRVALLEGDKIGGTCLNYGCRPTKALRASAKVAHMARRAAEFGINVGAVQVDFAAVMARKDNIIGGMQGGADNYYRNFDGLDVIDAYGHFVGKSSDLFQMQAGDALLEAPEVYLNVGTRPFVPPIEGLQDVPYLTNNELLSLTELPDHMIVIGGGYIGLEFGQMFRRFGSEISIIEGSKHLASREDDDISSAVEGILAEEGIRIYTEHRVVRVEATALGARVHMTDSAGVEKVIEGTHLLVAVGRVPNTDKLNLDAVGLTTDKRGFIQTDGHYATAVKGIWALGDINGRGAFTHTSYQDYEIALDNHNGGSRSADERVTTYAMFTDPPLGRVGMTEREARQFGKRVLMSVWKMANISRAKLDSETQGLIKVLVDADSERIIGAATLGLHGDDLIQIFSNFMATGASYKVMQQALPVHPTVAEFLPTILGALKEI
jgi:pyruvate/2-oxoglutarate dehydrogenase complex dihydrolipoamide dehydrogenase (E3) component